MIKNLFFSLIIFILLSVSVFSQTTGKVSLIVKYSSDLNDIDESIMRINFEDGRFISQKILFSTKLDNDSNNFIWLYKERYVLLQKSAGGDWKFKDLKAFDLNTDKFIDRKTLPLQEKVDLNNYEIKSPDGKKGIKFTDLLEGVEKLVIRIEGQNDLVINEKFEATVASKSSILPNLPLLWLDNERILTQKKNGSLVIVTLDGKVTPFLELPCTSDDFPLFKITKARKLIYKCSSTEYLIDVENKNYSRIKNDLDYDFSFDYIDDKQVYFFKDKPIDGEGVEEIATFGYLATTYGKRGKYGFFDANDMNIINVWNQFTEKWQTLTVDGSHIEILGWFHNVK